MCGFEIKMIKYRFQYLERAQKKKRRKKQKTKN